MIQPVKTEAEHKKENKRRKGNYHGLSDVRWHTMRIA